MPAELSTDRDRCVGSGQCVLIAPDVFAQRPEDGTVTVLSDHPAPGRLRDVRDAVDRCPVGAIRLRGEEPS